MRRAFVACLLLLTLAGCARTGQSPTITPPAPQEATDAPEPAPVPTPPSSPPAVPARPIEADLPVPAPLPAGLRRVELEAGAAPGEPGFYFLEVASGKLEGWPAPLDSNRWPAYHLTASEDEGWLLATGQEQGYLIRRSDGAAFQYDPRRLTLTLGPGVFLAKPRNGVAGDGSKCALLDAEVKLISAFALPGGCDRDPRALFSPDGKFLALTGQADGPAAFVVTVATGAVRELGAFSIPSGHSLYGRRLAALPATNEFIVELQLAVGGDWPPATAVVRRYTWAGDLRRELELPGWDVRPSPDGKLIIYSQSLGLLGQAAVVHEWGAERPLFRVAGGQWPEWLAGGKDLVMHSSQGYHLASTAGALRQGPPTASGAMFNPFIHLSPAPDAADLFLTNSPYSDLLSVIDRAGRTRRTVSLGDPKLRIGGAQWGPSSRTLQFTVYPPGGKGYEGEIWNYIAPKVQRPPFPDKLPLKVADPQGECLNLRAEPGAQGKVIRCLPTGTRLGLPKPDTRWDGQWIWVLAETEQGETGWVAANTSSLVYAD